VGSTLAFVNNACESGQHGWCAASDFRHSARAGRSQPN
jgi:hypothetical protein